MLLRCLVLLLALHSWAAAQDVPEHQQYITFNPDNPSIGAQLSANAPRRIMIGEEAAQDLMCYVLNTAAERMEPQGFGGQAPKPWTTYGFHATGILETQIAVSPSATFYRPLSRLPKNDGCAYQAAFGARPASGCNITGVKAEPIPAGGFQFPRPSANESHCQRFSSCIDNEMWTSDPRHKQDIGAQGQWCSEIGGCWQPATGVRTNNGCLCYSDRPLKDWYGPNVKPETIPPPVDGNRALECTLGWVRLLGGTRCGYYGYGTEGQHPTGPVIRDKGEGRQDNPALATLHNSNKLSEDKEQDSASFVFRRHPSCLEWSYIEDPTDGTNATNTSDTLSNATNSTGTTSAPETTSSTTPAPTTSSTTPPPTTTPTPANITTVTTETPAPFSPLTNSNSTPGTPPPNNSSNRRVDPNSIRSVANCRHEGQVQLAARTVSDTGTELIQPFRSLLNHSVVVTLRITYEEKRAVFDLLASDGVTLLESHSLPTRFCHSHRLGRNLPMSRVPLADEETVDPRCSLITPIQACYSSDPALWGTALWKRNAATSLGDILGESAEVVPRRGPGAPRCQPPFCI